MPEDLISIHTLREIRVALELHHGCLALCGKLQRLCSSPALGRHLFMTPVMAVIVIVEITCQEAPSRVLTRPDRGRGGDRLGCMRGAGGASVVMVVVGDGEDALMTSPLIISLGGLWDNSAVNGT